MSASGSQGLVATPRDRWIEIQRELIQSESWIIDGDLGRYDVLEPRTVF
jgi:hypothetical protein